MATYTNDTKPTSGNTSGLILQVAFWDDSSAAWDASGYSWSDGDIYTRDSKPTGSYTHDSKPS